MVRSIHIDAISGILIIYMVIGHIFQWSGLSDNIIYKYSSIVLYFFMPWFFYKSGMYHNQERPIKTIIYNCINKLLKPTILGFIIGIVLYWLNLLLIKDYNIIHYILSPIKSFMFGDITGNTPLWFIISLIIIKPIFHLFLKCDKRIRYVIVLLIIVLFRFNIRYLFLNNIFLGFLFYLIGYYIEHFFEKQLLIPISILVYFYSCLYENQIVDFHTQNIITGSYIAWFLASIAGIITINYLFSYFENRKFIKPISLIGKQSLKILIYHWPILYLINLAIHCTNVEVSRWSMFFIYLIISTTILSILCFVNMKKNE